MIRRSYAAALLVFALGLALGTGARADEDAESAGARARALLMLHVLAYDHNLRERAGDEITIVVVHEPRDPTSRRSRDQLLEALTYLQQLKIGGLPFTVVPIGFRDTASLAARLGAGRAAALVVCPGLERQAAAIGGVTRRAGVLSFAGTEAELRDGLSVGIVTRGGRDRLLVNVAASRLEGARLDAGLLHLAGHVDEEDPTTAGRAAVRP